MLLRKLKPASILFPLIAATLVFAVVKPARSGYQGPTVNFDPSLTSGTVSNLNSISGTVSDSSAQVYISIGRAETDLEWVPNNFNGKFRTEAKRRAPGGRWVTGPTGWWLPTTSTGSGWSAPTAQYVMPSASNLPNGRYTIIAYARSNSGTAGPQQRITVTVSHP